MLIKPAGSVAQRLLALAGEHDRRLGPLEAELADARSGRTGRRCDLHRAREVGWGDEPEEMVVSRQRRANDARQCADRTWRGRGRY